MTSVSQTAVHFACHKCGVIYRAVQTRHASSGRFDCLDCFAEVHKWSGIYDYTAWKPVWATTERPTSRKN
jgi:protein-arginine kinase activator protein McsA